MAILHTESFGWSDTRADYVAYKGYTGFGANGLGDPWRHSPGAWTGTYGSYYADLSYAGTTPSNGGLTYPVSGHWIVGFRSNKINLGGFSGGGSWILAQANSSFMLGTAGTNVLKLQNTGSGIWVAAGTHTVTDTWHYIEVDWNPGTAINVYVDGALDFTYTNAVVDTPSAITFENMWVQDIYLADTTAPNGSHLSDVHVEYRPDTGAGASTLWTPNGAGSNWQCVDDSPRPDGDTTYVSTAGVGNRDSYALPSINEATPTSVPAVACYIIADKDNTAPRGVKPSIHSGSADLDGTELALANGTYNGARVIAQVDPSTSAPWTASGANAAKPGILLSS